MATKKFDDRYIFRKKLGEGGMGIVFQAHDPKTNRNVAIKILPSHDLNRQESLERFRREAQAIAQLEHQAIIPVYDFGVEAGRRPYLVMRLMTGRTLADRIAQAPVPLAETIEILKPIADALDKVHAQGLVHRDIKPSNIMFDEDGNAYLGDFGLVGYMSGHSQTNWTTSTGGAFGTPHYMSPEQAKAVNELDRRSDIYSLGVVIYEMLTGKLPYDADTPLGLAMKHVSEPVPEILADNATLPPACDLVIRRTLAKNKQDRYRHASMVIVDLKAALTGQSLRTKPLPSPKDQKNTISKPRQHARVIPTTKKETRAKKARKSKNPLPSIAAVIILIGICLGLAVTFGPALIDNGDVAVVTTSSTAVATTIVESMPTSLVNAVAPTDIIESISTAIPNEPVATPLEIATIDDSVSESEQLPTNTPLPTETTVSTPAPMPTRLPSPTPFPAISASGTAGSGSTDIYRSWRPEQVIEISGELEQDTVWMSGNLYYVTQNVSIPDGIQLTIQPGVIIKMSSGRSLLVAGTLLAEGTAEQPIIFTSYLDDTIGGDTNGDASNSTPAAGNWHRIEMSAGSDASILRYVNIKYAGASDYPALALKGASPRIDQVTIADNKGAGILIDQGSSVQISNSRIEDNNGIGITISKGSRPTLANNVIARNGYAIQSHPQWLPILQGNSLLGNTVNALALSGGSVTEVSDWYLVEHPIYVLSNITIVDGAQLTIQPGVIIKMSSGRSLLVAGTLLAEGTAEQPIIFTSYLDDTIGGDTNGDASNSTPTAGNWHRIEMSTGSDASILRYVNIKYAGASDYPALALKGASPRIDQVTIADNKGAGILIDQGSSVQISNSRVEDNNGIGIIISEGSRPTLANNVIARNGYAIQSHPQWLPILQGNSLLGNTVNALALSGGSVTEVSDWYLVEHPIYVLSNITIVDGAQLTIQPGVIIKMSSGRSLLVAGTLLAEGTAEQPIIFTSYLDDTIGGDTNGDASNSTPAAGNWHRIEMSTGSNASILRHVNIKYAGASDYPALALKGASPTLDYVTISDVRGLQLSCESGASPTISNSQFTETDCTGS